MLFFILMVIIPIILFSYICYLLAEYCSREGGNKIEGSTKY